MLKGILIKNTLRIQLSLPGRGSRPKNTFFAHHVGYFVKNLSIYLYYFFRYVTFYDKMTFSYQGKSMRRVLYRQKIFFFFLKSGQLLLVILRAIYHFRSLVNSWLWVFQTCLQHTCPYIPNWVLNHSNSHFLLLCPPMLMWPDLWVAQKTRIPRFL